VASSNSNRLKELAETVGVRSFLIDDASEIQDDWLEGVKRIGVTAGASAPEILITEVIDKLKRSGGIEIEESPGIEENIVFVLPAELR
ncbi:MAG: 4-hydroxy-3-methylbut-2-enyl diphosphate reductase, partial [Enterobacterales bacterium]